MERLHPCPACARHVRSNERTCPFCDATLPPAPALTGAPSGRLGRAALFAFRTTTVVALGALSACGDDRTQEPPPIQTPPEETIAQPYGAPPTPQPEPPPLPEPPPPDPLPQSPPEPDPIAPDETIAQPPEPRPRRHTREEQRTTPAYGTPSHHPEPSVSAYGGPSPDDGPEL